MAVAPPEASGDRVAGEEASVPAAGRLVKRVRHHRLVTANHLGPRDGPQTVLRGAASEDLDLRVGALAALVLPAAVLVA